MAELFHRITALITSGKVRISSHGYDELMADGILAKEIVEGVTGARFTLCGAYPAVPMPRQS